MLKEMEKKGRGEAELKTGTDANNSIYNSFKKYLGINFKGM
jgi:hypothetical protein